MGTNYYIYLVVRNRNGRMDIQRAHAGRNRHIDFRSLASCFIELLEQLIPEESYHLDELPDGGDLHQLLHRWLCFRDHWEKEALTGTLVKVPDEEWYYVWEPDQPSHLHEILMTSVKLLGVLNENSSDYVFRDEYGDLRNLNEWLESCRRTELPHSYNLTHDTDFF